MKTLIYYSPWIPIIGIYFAIKFKDSVNSTLVTKKPYSAQYFLTAIWQGILCSIGFGWIIYQIPS